ncbi:ABC-2 type transport system permease protein [Pseudobutyrivibrio sp. UC1225]|nr:ABC-2 type transport system permease protein [Pseudobutyrivibrio sp. UC1225]
MISGIKAVIIKNRLIVKRAYPWTFVTSRIIGGIFSMAIPILLYYSVFNTEVSGAFIKYAHGCDYLTYLMIGQVLNVLSFSTLMSVGRCLITEQREGTLDNILLSPVSRVGYFVGTYIEQFGRSIFESAFVVLFGVIVGARIPFDSIPIILLCIFFSSLTFFSMSIMVSTIMIYTRDTYLVQNTFYLLMSCICGVAFPIEYLPKGLQLLSDIFPLTYAIKITRLCSLGIIQIQAYFDPIVKLVALSFLYFLLGYYGFRIHEKKLIEDVLA